MAGPDVFLRDPKTTAEKKKAICAAAGFTGVSPVDNEVTLENPDKAQNAIIISRENERLMGACYLIIANMMPLRGPSMAVGVAYEIGYSAAGGPSSVTQTTAAPIWKKSKLTSLR